MKKKIYGRKVGSKEGMALLIEPPPARKPNEQAD